MRKRKFNLLLIIFVIVLVLGLGYAYLTTTLSINGTTDVDANTWNIYWDNVQVKTGSVTASTPVIDTSKTTVTFSIHLSQPGDFYEFTVDAKNTGTIDAMIDTITKTTNIPNYLNYTVTYDDGIEITSTQKLEANSTEKIKVRVEYRTDINASDLPSTSQAITLSFGATYVQANSSAHNIRGVVYTTSSTNFQIGQAIPNNVTTHSNYQDAITAYGHPVFFKHILVNDIITETHLGFVYNSNVYYLQIGGATYNSSTGDYNYDSPYYATNKNTLRTAFGSSKCSEVGAGGGYVDYYCSDNAANIDATAANNGYVYSENRCYGFEEGISYCS